MKYYLKGTILESIERAKKLKAKFPNGLNVYFQKLAESSLNKIDEVISHLNYYLTDSRYLTDNNQQHRLKALKELVRELDILENVVVAAINRYDEKDDVRVNVMVQKICKEINYPLIPPTVTCLSQEYYRIFPSYNLLCVPLLECEFLLHLPDLYHELGHPLLDLQDNPKIEEFNNQIGGFYFLVRSHFDKLIQDDQRVNNSEYTDHYQRWQSFWQNWSIEFFCDLFGVCTLGPAYAWSHFHLSAKQGQNPFYVKKVGDYSSHPNDESRMQVICLALELLGYNDEKNKVIEKWESLQEIIPYGHDPAFELAYPKELLELCAIHGLEAVKGIGCNVANKSNSGEIFSMLNEAWEKFWKNPEEYFLWESKSVNKLT